MQTTIRCSNPTANSAEGGAGTTAISDRKSCQEQPWTLDGLAASVVHDIRNPLAAICGCAEMLLGADLDQSQTRRLATNIHRAAGTIRELVSDFAQVGCAAIDRTESYNLRLLIAESCEASGLADRDGVAAQVNVPAQIDVPLIRTQMKRVFVNLIVNALEAMPHGGAIRITAVEAGSCVLIAFEDDGPGIPAQIGNSLFEPFVTAGKKEGLGLGLALSRQTVRKHGGELWVEPASGGRFVISLPLGPSAGHSRSKGCPPSATV